MPFKWALRRSEIISRVDLQEDIPSICAQKLKFRQVDLALVPVAILPELSEYRIVSGFCIGADGVVDSVKLYSEVPLEQITGIILDYQSRSSIALTKVLCRFAWKISPSFTEAAPGFEKQVSGTNAAVVIGDRTFELNGKYRYEFDLANEWKKFTGLPFVFAAWVSVTEIEKQFIKDFNEVLSYGVDNISKAVSESYQGAILSAEEVTEYLTQRIDYRLDDKKMEGLEKFLSLLKQI